MLKKLFPDIYINSIDEMPIERLKRLGIKALVFDIDNTLVPYDVAEPDDALIETIEKLKREGFKICLLSNNNERRVSLFNEKPNVLAIHKAGKPGVKKLKCAMEAMKTTSKTTAFVGDQVFTDMWCGHSANMLSIMTAPVCDRDQLVTKVKRPLEKLVMKAYFKKVGRI